MKAKELRQLDNSQLKQKLGELNDALFNHRFTKKIGSLEKPSVIRQTKREIARILTVLTEKKA